MNLTQIYFTQLLGFLGEYFIFAGIAYVLLYVFLPKLFSSRKVHALLPLSSEVRREILYSIQSLAIFAAVAAGVVLMFVAGVTKLYLRVDTYGWPYFWLSVILFILIHDTWFYWTHRMLHWPSLYRIAHRAHHRSRHPTPWASFAFHPLEAVIQAIIYPIVILFLPLHPWAGMIWLAYMGIMNVFLHLGVELLPRGFATHWLFRWHNTTVHHDMHHTHGHSNYGLYFNIWDRLMGTNHTDYESTFEKVTAGRTEKESKKKQHRRRSAA